MPPVLSPVLYTQKCWAGIFLAIIHATGYVYTSVGAFKAIRNHFEIKGLVVCVCVCV